MYALTIAFEDKWNDSMRKYQGEHCLDSQPFNALFLLGVNLLINLLPARIYCYMFMSEMEVEEETLL